MSSFPTVTKPIDNTEPNSDELDSCQDILSGTFVPMKFRQSTEKEIIQTTVNPMHVIEWPQISNTPIDEFHTEGYFTMAFPCLFPTGSGDYTSPRQRRITLGYYIKHMMLYKDGRFARHSRFRYFALNTSMRWHSLQTGRIYVRQNPTDAQLTIDELRQLVNNEDDSFANRVVHFGYTLRGTAQYWFKQRSQKNILSAVEHLQ